MCGICGELKWNGETPDVFDMLPHLQRRGLNGEGVWQQSLIALGHRRLAVIDPVSQSNQPFVDEGLGLALVFNGTLYNYHTLKKELEHLGYQFQTRGDTEVLLKAFHAWGEACLSRFDGMFAFAIWNMREQVLFLARDRTGIKPLYYTQDADGFRFASTTRALMKKGFDKSLNLVGLHHFFMLHGAVPAPHTLYQKILKLQPATWMKINGQGKLLGQKVYWQLPKYPLREIEDFSVFKESLDAAILREYEVSDVPVGLLLSGGLDSSYIVAVLHAHGVKNLPTFTIGFESHQYEQGDEFQYSDMVAKQFQTEHHRMRVSNAIFVERLPEVIHEMSEPLMSQDALGFYMLAEMVQKAGFKVVLSGQGADELLGGYQFYANMLAASGHALKRVQSQYFETTHERLGQWLMPQYLVESDVSSAWMGEALLDDAHFMYSFLRQDISQLIVDDPVRRVDNMTMSWGVEARVPFLCHHVIEQGMRIPSALKMQNNGKWPLKKLAESYFSQEFIHRPKGYFPAPLLKFIEDPVYSMIKDVLNSKACLERGLFKRDVIEQLIMQPNQQYSPMGFNLFWVMGLLELWFLSH